MIAVVGVLIGIGAYQQAQLEKEQKEAEQASIDLIQKAAEAKPSEAKPSEAKPVQSKTIQKETPQFFDCTGSAGCFTDKVTRIVDGDTIYTETLKIRLSLTDTPELGDPGFYQAAQFTEMLCPVGSTILVDQDDLQPVDEYGRVLAKVYCGNKSLNSELLYNAYADILTKYCSTSEFSGEAWAQENGCGPAEIQPLVTNSDLEKSPLQIKVDGEKQVRRGTTHTIEIQVVRGDIPIEGARVFIDIEDYGEDIIREFDGYTDSEGYFVFSWEIPQSYDDLETLLAFIDVTDGISSKTELFKFQVYCLAGEKNCKVDGN